MSQYCRPYYEFSLFDEFKPGEFKIIDFLRENTSCFLREHTDQDEELSHRFLDMLRWLDAWGYKPNIDIAYVIDVLGDFSLDDSLEDEFITLLESTVDKEFDSIIKILKGKRFIHTDNFYRSFLISDMLTHPMGEPWRTVGDKISHNWDWNTYEATRPITDREIKSIFAVLRDNLSPIQYEIARFFIINASDRYDYTKLEREALDTALFNIYRINYLIKDLLF